MLLELLFSFLKVGLFSIGGGMVSITLLAEQLVQEKGWLTATAFNDLIAIAESTPGPIAVNAATFVGLQLAGIPGALITVLGTVLPPLVIISVISLFYQAFRDNAVVSMAMAGMLCGVAAVIFDVVFGMMKTVLRQKRVQPVMVLIGAFLAVRFFSVNIVIIILVCGLIGAADTWYRNSMRKEPVKP